MTTDLDLLARGNATLLASWEAYARGSSSRRVGRITAARGCTTASLQSTVIAERVYAAAGFRDLGRFIEYVPAALIRSG